MISGSGLGYWPPGKGWAGISGWPPGKGWGG